jgi:fumarylacetoacetate (FAA) hydrolase
LKLATGRSPTPDGRLMVVSHDLSSAVPATGIAGTLQQAIDHWDEAAPSLQALYVRLNAGDLQGAVRFQPEAMAAPLPRAWQWLDGSAFPTHGKLMQRAFGLPAINTTLPLMYQGMSHRFLGATEDVAFPSEKDEIDFEGEFGIITGAVPMSSTADAAWSQIRLIVQINDWSLRAIAPIEMKTGFGWIQAKPACSVAPVAVTPDEFGAAWRQGRLNATLEVCRNGDVFGVVPSDEMEFGFHDLIAHAARTRAICSGTIIGSGTVSTSMFRDAGSCCISERRAIEMIDFSEPRTGFLKFGERISMQTRVAGHTVSPFGMLDQRIVKAVTRQPAFSPP